MIQVRASQIFTHSMEDCVAAKKLLDSGTSFLDAVEKYSTCPSKQNGGDLGWMPEGSLQSIMGSTVSENDKGKIIGPVHSQYGYHILVISDIEVEGTEGPFTTATPMIEVSVIIPTFNRKEKLRKALQSALAQEEVSFEVLVIDDGSTDGTQEMVEKEFPQVSIQRQENQGHDSLGIMPPRDRSRSALI